MKIAICEDNQPEADWLKKVITDWAAKNQYGAEILWYSDTKQFLFAYEETCFDVLFLDIQMPGEDGISLARRLRARKDAVPIVFVTGLDEYISEGYEVEAVHYLIKPVKEEKVRECLERIAKRVEEQEPYVMLHTSDGVFKVLQKDILKIEIFGRQCTYSTFDREYTVVQSLKEAKETLASEYFVPCYRGVLVNVQHIQAIEHSRVVLTGGKEALVSRRMYASLNQAFIDFFQKGTRL